jgi:hypothetical protein
MPRRFLTHVFYRTENSIVVVLILRSWAQSIVKQAIAPVLLLAVLSDVEMEAKNQRNPRWTYEGGAYSDCNTYRPLPSCYMRDYAPFCPVCADVIRQVLQPLQPPIA